MSPFLLTFVFLFGVGAYALAPVRYEERAVLVCAAADKTQCASQAEYLKACGVKLIEGKSAASGDLRALLANLSSDVPAYIVADGKAADFERVSRLVGRRPSWIQICSGTEQCTYSLSGISVPRCDGPLRKNTQRRAALEMMTRLICNKENFDGVDKEKVDGILSAPEVNLFLTEKLNGVQKRMAANLAPDAAPGALKKLQEEEAAFGMTGHAEWKTDSGKNGKVSVWREDRTQLCLADASAATSSAGNSFHAFRSPWIDWSKEQSRFIDRDIDH